MKTMALSLIVILMVFLVACTGVPDASATPPAKQDNTTVSTPTSTQEIPYSTVIPKPEQKPPPTTIPGSPPTPTPSLPITSTTSFTPTPSLTPTPTTSSSSSSMWTYWGPASFGKDYPATPGMRIEFIDMKRGTNQEGNPTMYLRPVAMGLPENETYYLWSKKLGQILPIQLTSLEMSITSGGDVIPKGSTNPVSLGFDSFARGEARVIALMNVDHSIIAYGKVVMYPIQANQGNTRIWVELMSSAGNLFAIYGSGFEPDEELTATSNSEGEIMEFKVNVNDEGKFTNILLPAIVGKESGLVTYTIVGKAGTLKVSFNWGPPALLPGL